jgi:hypothetical protein
MNAFAGEGQGDFGVPFQEAIDYFRQKIALPTKHWRDLHGRSHDRAAVVAGATKEALLSDLLGEIDKAIAGKSTLEMFRASFEEIVARNGWTGWTGEGTAKGRAWRTRVIYETNLATSYAAGRYKQMTDPDAVKVYKWWRYRHAYYRVPKDPREQHVTWDGLILAWDDPFWETHYPPNDWFCSCGVESLTDDDLADTDLKPGVAPDLGTRDVRDPRTDELVNVPNGVGFGWAHAPGRDWARGLVPPQLQNPLKPSIGPVLPPPALPINSRPLSSRLMPEGLSTNEYVDAFLAEFGASRDAAAIWRDPAGHALAISDALFRTGQGRLKLGKGVRDQHVLRLAEAIRDPDEIWIDWANGPDGRPRLVRRYLRFSSDSPEFAAFAWSAIGWEGATAFNPTKGDGGKPDQAYLARQRSGVMLWRRETK